VEDDLNIIYDAPPNPKGFAGERSGKL